MKLGETARTSKLEVTVDKVFKTRVLGGEYANYWAKDGYVLILVHVIVKNVDSNSKHYVSPSDFSVSDESGRKYDQTYVTVEGKFEGTTLFPGEYTEGIIAFEVPENAKILKIKYDFGFFTVKLASWEVKMEDIPAKELRVKILNMSIDYEYDSLIDAYYVEKVTIVMKNNGSLPIYVGKIEIKYGEDPWELLGYGLQLLQPGETTTIVENEFQKIEAPPEDIGVHVRIVDSGHVIAEAFYTKSNTETTTEPATTFSTLEYGKKYEVKVVNVIDGDTIDVLFPNGTVDRVRMLGVDTPEKRAGDNKPYEYDSITDLNYLAEWGVKAAQFTESMLEGKEVYIEFDELAGMRGYYGRLLAYVYLENGTDFTAELVKQGYARAYAEGKFKKKEYYMELEEEAKREGRGLWSILTTTTTTSLNGSRTVSVKITYVHYDAAGNDNYNLNDEYVVITNVGDTSVKLEDWILRDEAGHTFVFPSIILEPGENVTVYSGSGVDTDNELYWGRGQAVWNNDGDTAYLYDANGNLVDTYTW